MSNGKKKSRSEVVAEYFDLSNIAFLKNVKLQPNKESTWSKSFCENKEGKCSTLIEVFDIKSADLFRTKFNEAATGLERSRILTLHSSSLAALLLFHAVSDKNPIWIPIAGEDKKFTEVKFEVKYSVDKTDKKNKSNIDILLSGEDASGKKDVLFLESKFSEYLESGTAKISGRKYYQTIYKTIYESLKDKDLKLEIGGLDSDSDVIYLKGRGLYCKGIKQMVSHYMGLRTEYKSNSSIKGKNIVLGEILFNFGDAANPHPMFNSYKEIYPSLKDALEQIVKDDKIELTINNIITYQEIFEHPKNRKYLERLPERIREFYLYRTSL